MYENIHALSRGRVYERRAVEEEISSRDQKKYSQPGHLITFHGGHPTNSFFLQRWSNAIFLHKCFKIKFKTLEILLRSLSDGLEISVSMRRNFCFTARVQLIWLTFRWFAGFLGFETGRGHKSQVSLLTWRVYEPFNSPRTEPAVISLPRELWTECRT